MPLTNEIFFCFIISFYLFIYFVVVVVVIIFTLRSLKLHAIPSYFSGIICGPPWESLAVEFGDYLRSGIICSLGIICSAVQYFPVVLFILLYKMVLTFKSVDEILKCDHSNESYWILFSEVLFLLCTRWFYF